MRKILLLAVVFATSFTAFGQDFSNKGKDFWVGYGFHSNMNTNSQDMVLYFATDQVTNIQITIPATGYTQNITTPGGNNVTTSAVIPKNGVQDARLLAGGLSNNGIHITSDRPMVAYAHIYNGNCSGATILYPTNTLGREYYSVNYKNWSNNATANCWFYVMATDTGTTTIEITPQANIAGVVTTPASGGWTAGTTYTVNLTQGQIYNVMGILTATPGGCNPVCTGVDLTGSKIKSINNGTGCKKISVFSGTGRISISCDAQQSSSDNYMVQAMPRNAWGKKYLTVQANGNQANNIYRVCVSNPAAVVKINGSVTALPLQNNFYYEIPATNQPQLIEADSAIMVAQYFTSQNECGNGNPGDPEVIYLSAVEQNINKVLWNATPNFAITNHYYNVVIPNTGTALSSFRLDGNPVSGWITHPQEPNFSYLRMAVGANAHVIQSDSGFNAIAYGFANAESYGYNAGTNIRDLYQQIGVQTTYGIENTPSVCTNSPFKFKVSLPYIPDSMRWNFNGAVGMLPNNNTVYVNNTGNIAQDSTTVVNGKTLHWYSAPLQYTFSTVGVYPITITTFVPNGECGAQQDIDFDLTVSDPPTASINVVIPGCYLEPVTAAETTPQIPKTTYKLWWEFFDPVTNITTVYTTIPTNAYRTVSHTFTTPGTIALGTAKRIRHASITTPGCLSDTIVQIIEIPDIPSATIAGNTTACINTGDKPVTFTGTGGTAEYIFSYTIDNGSGPGPVLTTPASTGGSVTINAPTTVAGTFVYNLVGVRNELPAGTPCTRAITGQSITVTVLPDHAISLGSGNPDQTVCINTPLNPFTLTISGGATGILPAVGLPPGVTATLAGTTVTILGTPTVAGSYPYSITTTGNACLTANFTGTITVNPDHSISLGSGNPNPAVCINTPITPFTLTLADGATGIAAPVGLPAGVTATTVGNIVTIQGTPTVSGTFNYTITTTGNTCIVATFTGTITVDPDHTIGLNGGTPDPTLCVNTVMAAFTLSIGGGATGISPSGLPPGVTANLVGTNVIIQGIPTLAGSYPYTITTTGNTCVPASYSNTITVTADATITLLSGSTNQAVCRNTAIAPIDYQVGASATGATISWAPSAPTGITFTPVGANGYQIAGTPTVVGTQTYTYTITTTGPCVNPTATGSITVYALPIAAFNTTTPRCTNNFVTFNNTSTPNAGPTTTWTWDFGDGSLTSSLQNPTHIYSVPNSYTATLTVVNSNGCISDPIASQTFVVNDTPRAGFIVPEVCINDLATPFIDTSNIPTGSIIRAQNQWNYGDPFATPGNPNTSVGQDGLHLYTVVGTYTVTQIVTSNTGCTDTIKLDITISAADPVSNFTVSNSCSSDSISLVNLSTVSFGNVTRLDIYWDNVGAPGTFETINVPVFNAVYKHKYPTLQTTQTYTIRMVAYSGNVCFTSSTNPVTVYATPVVQFNAIPNTCYLVAPFQLTQGSEIGGVPGTGTYSGPGITNPNGTFDPQVAGIGTHDIKYTWTASNPGACIDTLTRTITVLDTAHATFSVALPSCEQTPTLFTNLSTAPPTVTLASTVWDFGDASGPQTFAIAAPVSHTYANPGSYTVTMHTVSTTPPTPGCLSTDTTMVVTIDANHHITWDATSGSENQPLCVNTSIVPIRYTLSGGATNVNFIPSLPPGLTYTVAGTPLTLTISGAPTTPANYSFDIETSGNTCVKDISTVTISVAPDHAIALRAGSDTAQSVCLNTPIDDIFYDLSGGATGVTIAGLPAGINYTVTGNELRIYGTPTAIPPGGPGYTITTTGNSCLTASKIGEIVVHPYPVPSFTVDKPGYCIPNAIVKFTNTSTTPDGSPMTYIWNFGDGSPTVTSVNPTHWYTSGTGPFVVNLSVTSVTNPILNNGQPGCNSFIDVPMTTIHPQPKADFVFSKPSVCIGDNVTITDNTDGKDGIVNQWNWDLGDGTTRITNPLTHTYGDTITYNITLYSVNTHGCNSDTITKPFTVYPYPKVNAGPDKFVLEGGSVELEATAYGREPQYTWTPGDYLTDAKILRPRVTNPKTDMTYRLTVTGKGGCALSDDVFVKLLKFPVIPNTFTPNGDGINDTWRIDFLNTYPNNRVQIFTRSGKMVFESRGYNTPWNGTINGKPLPFDTYYYIIEPGNGRDPITGYVTILK